jgi:hypothetical protein
MPRGTGMRKIFPRPGLLLVPAICLLTSCASYKMVQPPPSSAAGGHEFLYVLSTWYTGTGDPSSQSATHGYSVSADGRLTPLTGFPKTGWFWGVASGRYYFTPDPDNVHLDTYQIGTDGSFTKIYSVLDQATAHCTDQCSIRPDIADPVGSSLYVHIYSYNSGDGLLTPETYSIDKSTGELTYVAQGGADWTFGHGGCQLYDFSPDGRYVYGSCTSAYGDWLDISVRNPDGSLTEAPKIKVTGPTPPAGTFYSGVPAGGDTENHLAAIIFSFDSNGVYLYNSPPLLASYTINADGSLTSTNTAADMPPVHDFVVTAGVSPSGKLLAVGEQGGIQLFNFNGAAPATADGGVIATDPPQTMQWDTQNHLFVLSSTHKLYVFTVTGSSLVQAPGSPYSIPNAGYFVVASF